MTVAAEDVAPFVCRALGERIGHARLQPMAVKGIAHDHFRIAGAGLIVRAPRVSQWSLPPVENLAYQAACFERAAASGRTPRLHAVIEPAPPTLPYGALIVEEVVGRPPRLPGDMTAIAGTLARVHGLPVPEPAGRPPLADHRDPTLGTLARIESQLAFVDRLTIDPAARRAIAAEHEWARDFATATRGLAQPIGLALTDTHPGNFLLTADGMAMFVDLEKALYGSPAIDLAHASLRTSTLWDPDCARILDADEAAAFYSAYFAEAGRGAREALGPWITPMRRLTWLRTTSWAARWLSENTDLAHLPARLRQWIEARMADTFDPGSIAAIRAEWLDGPTLDELI